MLTGKEVSLYGAMAFVGTIFTYMLGEMTAILHFMLICMAVDFVSGCVASIVEGSGLSSQVGFKGISKKCLMILSLWLAHYADIAIEVDWIMLGTIWFWISNELISITENYARLGLPLPDALKNVIAIVKNRAGQKDDN